MTRYVVDTNVPIVANGRPTQIDERAPSLVCREMAIEFLRKLLMKHVVILDMGGEIQTEYHRHLSPRGQPGVGDRFYLEVINSSPRRVQRVDLPKRVDGEYASLPQALIDAGFDPSDRKFAALAHQEDVPVCNATDSDWVEHAATLEVERIRVVHLCGSNPDQWFER